MQDTLSSHRSRGHTALVTLLLAVALAGNCQKQSPMRLRNAGSQWFLPEDVHLLIVGHGRWIVAEEFKSANVAVRDANGTRLRHSVSLVEETKMGPAIGLSVDARLARGPVTLSGTVTYGKTMYSLNASWREVARETAPWELASFPIYPEGPAEKPD